MQITIKGARDLQALADRIKRAKGTVRQELAQGLRAPTGEAVRKARAAIEAMPIRGYRTGGKRRFTKKRPGTHIRSRIARVIEAEISTSSANPRASIIVHDERLGDAKTLPWHFDTGAKFRHPIMGNRQAWASQSGQPWFYKTVNAEKDHYIDEADKALQRVVDRIGR